MSKAAGLFVDPPKGPVLLNYGIDECRFTKPVYPGMTVAVRFTAKEKISRISEILRTVVLRVSPGSYNLRPPSKRTRLTKRPTIVSSPWPKSRGSTNPSPDRPISNPESKRSTTPGKPVITAKSLAPAPAKTVTPHSRPSRSGVIKNLLQKLSVQFKMILGTKNEPCTKSR